MVHRIEEHRRARENEQMAQDQASSYLEARMRQLVEREQGAARQRASDREQASRRREAVRSAARSFDLADLGQARESGGGEFHRRNRFQFVEQVFGLGGEAC